MQRLARPAKFVWSEHKFDLDIGTLPGLKAQFDQNDEQVQVKFNGIRAWLRQHLDISTLAVEWFVNGFSTIARGDEKQLEDILHKYIKGVSTDNITENPLFTDCAVEKLRDIWTSAIPYDQKITNAGESLLGIMKNIDDNRERTAVFTVNKAQLNPKPKQ